MKKGCKIPLITVGAIIGAFILLAILISIFVPEEELQKSAQARAERKKAAIEERAKQEALKAEIERKKIMPKEMAEKKRVKVEDSIKKIFGVAKNTDDSGIAWMVYAKPLHILDPDCIIRYRFYPLGLFLKYEGELGVKLSSKIKKLYKKHEEIKNIVIRIESPFVDKYGNIAWERVVSFEFSRHLFNRIDWHNFSDLDLLKVAENVIWHRTP